MTASRPTSLGGLHPIEFSHGSSNGLASKSLSPSISVFIAGNCLNQKQWSSMMLSFWFQHHLAFKNEIRGEIPLLRLDDAKCNYCLSDTRRDSIVFFVVV